MQNKKKTFKCWVSRLKLNGRKMAPIITFLCLLHVKGENNFYPLSWCFCAVCSSSRSHIFAFSSSVWIGSLKCWLERYLVFWEVILSEAHAVTLQKTCSFFWGFAFEKKWSGIVSIIFSFCPYRGHNDLVWNVYFFTKTLLIRFSYCIFHFCNLGTRSS